MNEKLNNIVSTLKEEILKSIVADLIPETTFEHFLHQYVKFTLKGKYLPLENFHLWLLGECDLPKGKSFELLKDLKARGEELDIVMLLPGEEMPPEALETNDEDDKLELHEDEDEIDHDELEDVPSVDFLDGYITPLPKEAPPKQAHPPTKAPEPAVVEDKEDADMQEIHEDATPLQKLPIVEASSKTDESEPQPAVEPTQKPATKPKAEEESVSTMVERLEHTLKSFLNNEGKTDDKIAKFIQTNLMPFEVMEEISFTGNLEEIQDETSRQWANYAWPVIRRTVATKFLLNIDYDNYNTLKGAKRNLLSMTMKKTKKHLEFASIQVKELQSIANELAKASKFDELSSLNKTLKSIEEVSSKLTSLHSAMNYVTGAPQPSLYKESKRPKNKAPARKAAKQRQQINARPIFALAIMALFVGMVGYFVVSYFMGSEGRSYDSDYYSSIIPIKDAVRTGNAFKAVVVDEWLELPREEKEESMKELLKRVKAREKNILGVILLDSKGNMAASSVGDTIMIADYGD